MNVVIPMALAPARSTVLGLPPWGPLARGLSPRAGPLFGLLEPAVDSLEQVEVVLVLQFFADGLDELAGLDFLPS